MSHDVVTELKIQKMEILSITAPYESDLQLVYLCKSSFVDAVLGEDADFLLCGCPKVITKSVGDGRCELISFEKVMELKKFVTPYKFNENDFRHMRILAGCDYFKKKGIGMATAYKKIVECQGDMSNDFSGF
eukprot:Pompholyxophrys_punicea_v1_NODE_995_length_1058_cov_2.778664.p1 type:complete len:132 gc:universal NODE_995_length_1058_cov_2.778664:677-282(-)